MSDNPILVLGGTGKSGRRVARQLASKGHATKVASRTGTTRFDWHDQDTWGTALDGTRAVYIVDEQGAQAADLLAEFTALATKNGVDRFVLLSQRTLDFWTHDDGMFRAERTISDVAGAWTILRPSWFAQNYSEDQFLRPDVVAGEVVLPDWTGLEPFIHADDIAAVAVAALTEPGHDGEIYSMSGPRLMTFGDCVDAIAAAAGREITKVDASPQEYVAHLVTRGFSPGFGEFALELLASVSDGRSGYLSDGVQRALGREPLDFDQYVAETDWSTVR
ncbi:NAD(P)H-binding protein [Lentzea sp. NPDC006480]|uniref:NAD(P)H-binding protein n=1 Tax=Lentzea sp. NPDC006480 TaxID=3157176 RepID=UPI0033BA50B4